ncbi:hypothetical protein SLEP1_g58626 [Rubroshorea leprosula]|uniref:Uncharacterized protein n=1 Tax=Rubroshorea leprosula TaxID=152421 RepID=A0AAV5MRF6_9ROSI|nr:hypothetical protein SLEP1_g58626 [Rubroshorea leprosula]
MAEVGEEEERTGADEAAGNSTTDDRKRKRSASPAGRTEDILPLLKKLASPEFDHIPTNEEVILTDLVGSSIITAEPPVEKVKKNMSTPVDNEWEWEVIIAEENNEEGEWEEIVAEENNEEWEWEEIIAEENNEDEHKFLGIASAGMRWNLHILFRISLVESSFAPCSLCSSR